MAAGYASEIFCSFQGEGVFAGRKHLFLRLAGCNLRCRYCDTPESLVRTQRCRIHGVAGRSDGSVANPIGVAELRVMLGELLANESGIHALAITGGEPLVQVDFLSELLRERSFGVPILLETNGAFPERVACLLPWIDIVSMDVKLPSNSGETSLWEEHSEFLKHSRAKTVYVKVPVDDGTSAEELDTAAKLVAAVDPTIPFFIQPILSPSARVQVTPQKLRQLYDRAAISLADVRVLPQAHRFLGID